MLQKPKSLSFVKITHRSFHNVQMEYRVAINKKTVAQSRLEDRLEGLWTLIAEQNDDAKGYAQELHEVTSEYHAATEERSAAQSNLYVCP